MTKSTQSRLRDAAIKEKTSGVLFFFFFFFAQGFSHSFSHTVHASLQLESRKTQVLLPVELKKKENDMGNMVFRHRATEFPPHDETFFRSMQAKLDHISVNILCGLASSAPGICIWNDLRFDPHR